MRQFYSLELESALSLQQVKLEPMGEFPDKHSALLSLDLKCVGPYDAERLMEIDSSIQNAIEADDYSYFSISQRGNVAGIRARNGGRQLSSVIEAFASSAADTSFVLTKASVHRLSMSIRHVLSAQEICQ